MDIFDLSDVDSDPAVPSRPRGASQAFGQAAGLTAGRAQGQAQGRGLGQGVGSQGGSPRAPSGEPAPLGSRGGSTDSVCLVGKLLHVKTFPSGWAIGRINTDEHGDLGVNGNALVGLTEKQTYEFAGRMERHKTYGLQLKVESVGLHVPASGKGIEKFLTQNYKGVGKKAAEKIVSFFSRQPGGLAQFRLDLLANPYSMDFSVAGVKRKTSMDTADGLKSLIYMDIATKIGGVELGDKLLRKIAAHLEEPSKSANNPIEKAWSILTENPYALIRDLDGYGFKTADMVARKVGFDLSRPERTAALVTHAIAEGCNAGGHVYLTMRDFHKIIKAIDPQVDVEQAVESAIQMQEPMVIDHGRFYTQANYKHERYLAKDLYERYSRPLRTQIFSDHEGRIDQAIDEAQSAVGLVMDDSQRAALKGLLLSFEPIHSITAGPGCGKTAIMEVLVQLLRGKTKQMRDPETAQMVEVPFKVGFCAPTGKAAKVLSGRISRYGLSASTIHSLLGVKGKDSSKDDEGEGDSQSGSSMFEHNRFNPLDFDLLVIDEFSMVDLALMYALFQALSPTCHAILLGDTKQLPSVGPGACLSDALELPFDHHRLNRTHRNDGGILEVVTLAGLGRIDFKNRPDVTFIDGLPAATQASISSVLNLYDEALDACGGDFSAVGLLIARRKGDPSTPGWNSTYLNAVLRDAYNPDQGRAIPGLAYVEGRVSARAGDKVYGTRFRVGDRVIIRKNMILERKEDGQTQLDPVVNGDTGRIDDFSMAKGHLQSLEIALDDDRQVSLGASDADVLDLAYAMTVHMSQGSEYKRIILISVNGHESFVHRGIVFTGFSRAKKHLTVLGDQDALIQIVGRPAPKRNTHLVERFRRLVRHAEAATA